MSDTKAFDPTTRCKHCGGLKKEHKRAAPFRCPTKLTESYWETWTAEEYAAVEKESRERAERIRLQAELARTCPFCRVIHKTLVPTVHNNGTAPCELRDLLHTALDALRAAELALVAAAPNGRDYYLQDASAVVAATNAHERRCADLDRMRRDLEEQFDHVQAVLDFQTEQRASRQEVRQ